MRIWGLVFAAGLVTVLSGCAGIAVASGPTPSADPVAEWAAHQADFLAEYGGFPEGDPAYTEEEARAALAVQADTAWSNQVTSAYPNAVRPTDGFVRWGENEDRVSLESDYVDCLTSRGVTVDVGYQADGTVGGISWSSEASESAAVEGYFCTWVAYPSRPQPPLNAARLGYMWDYYAEFMVPCFEANGVPQRAMVSREDWIAKAPRVGWSLEYPLLEADMDRVEEICPSDPIR